MSWKLKHQQEYEYLYIPEFDSTGIIAHGITTRSCGDMSPVAGKDNYQRMASILFQSDPKTIFVCRQIHGNNIYKPEKRCAYPPEADALITNRKGITLSIFTADCLPIFILDPEKEVIGLVHAGWRGTMARIGQKTLLEMKKIYQTNPKDCIIGIGTGICGKCYEIGATVVEYMLKEFASFTSFLQQKNGKNLLDISSLNKQQFKEAGVLEKNISVCKYCTAENNSLFYSYRMEGENAGRMMSVLRLR